MAATPTGSYRMINASVSRLFPGPRLSWELFLRGRKWVDENLFNGRYYIQKTRGIPVAKIAEPLRSRGGA